MSDYLSELEDIAEGDDLDVIIEQPPAVIDDVLASKLLARRRHRLREQAAMEAAWDAFMQPLICHRNAVMDRSRLDVERIETLLGGMLAAAQADDPKLKALHVPGGTLKSRKQQPEWVYDPDVFVPWADTVERAEMLTVKQVPNKVAAKVALHLPEGRPGDTVQPFTDDGEIVPGVTVTYRAPKLVIEQ